MKCEHGVSMGAGNYCRECDYTDDYHDKTHECLNWEDLQRSCPWKLNDYYCKNEMYPCRKESCAIHHFRKLV